MSEEDMKELDDILNSINQSIKTIWHNYKII
jgi:hypothetical protein